MATMKKVELIGKGSERTRRNLLVLDVGEETEGGGGDHEEHVAEDDGVLAAYSGEVGSDDGGSQQVSELEHAAGRGVRGAGG